MLQFSIVILQAVMRTTITILQVFLCTERGEGDEFCLHFSESTFCGFEVSIIELHISYATVADVLSGGYHWRFAER